MWVPPGKSANQHLWRYDVAQKQFLPPGVPGKPKGAQVEMPEDYTGQEPRGFHMVASPAGTQAPIEHINYTPETGEVSGRGVQAPPDKLNYTLLPAEALMQQQQPAGAGQGQGSSPAMGAGASVPSLGASDTPSQFAGTPPLMGSPVMTGPSPTTNRAAPTWGGGGTPFDTRMGMGAEGDDQDLLTTTTATGDAQSSAPNTTAPGTQGPAPVAGQAGATSTATSSNVPKNVNGQPAQPGDTIRIIYGTDGLPVQYMIYDSQDLYDNPKYRWVAGTSADKGIKTNTRADGTIDIIDPTKTGPDAVRTVGTPDPTLVAKAQNDAEIQKLNLQIALANQHIAEAKDANAVALAQAELATAKANAQRAQSEADKAAVDAANAGKAPKATPPNKIVDSTGEVFIPDPDTGMLVDQHIKEAAGTWEKYTDFKTGTIHIYNPQTHEDQILGPQDTYKDYAPQKADAGKWIQWDPAQQKYKVVYQEGPDTVTEWAGDQLIARNKNDPTAPPQVIWTKKQTQAELDAHDAAIDAHNTALQNMEKSKQDLATGRITAAQARVSMEKDLQDILHPKPMFSAQGDVFAPPGLTLNLQDWNPITGERGTRTISGGGVDPRVDKMIAEIDAYLAGGAPPTTKAEPAKAPFDTSSATPPDPVKRVDAGGGRQTNVDTSPGERDTSVGSQLAAPGDRPGYPGWDPQHLGGDAQPPTTRTTAAGDRAHYDAQGNLVGIDYINTAPPGYEEGQSPDQTQDQTPTEATAPNQEYFDPETGRRTGSEGMGNHMGAGMAAGYTGWAPRPGAFAPATGPGFLGAGADGVEQKFDAQGNPIHRDDFSPSQVDIQLSPGGHKPGVDVVPMPGHIANPGEIKGPGPAINTGVGLNLPDTTDQGANWIPGLHDLVTQKVNESLKELLGWPKLEHTPPPEGPPIGTQGGHDQPEIDPYDINKRKPLGPQQASDLKKGPGVRDISHLIGEGGTSPEDWADMSNEEGIGTATGRNADPESQRTLQELRDQYGTTGVGQDEAPPTTMPPSAGVPPTSPQIPPQGPGGEQPPQWLLTLLQAHPELLRMAGLGGQAAGGASPPGAPPAGWQPPQTPPTPQAPQPMGTGQEPPMPPMGAPPTPPPTGAPVAPSPEGAPMTPPLDPNDVAGIGHRFGQDMNVGEPQHSGVDLQAPEGTPTQSPVDGYVTRIENNPQGLGVTVVIQGMDGSEHRLGHLKETSAYAGQQVKMGQDLGSPVGDTGMTTGAHLHWGVRDGQGQPSDPTQALGPMANMPPVPGTQMMGPPGGVGGAAQQGQPQAPQPQMGGGQAGWNPRVGAGAGYQEDSGMPGYSTPLTLAPNRARALGTRYDTNYGWNPGNFPVTVKDTQPIGPLKINPMQAFGAGAEGHMGAGATQEWSALQQQLQQTWNTMQQGQMSPGGLGARMAPQGSMFGVPQRPAQPPPTMQGAAPPQAPQPPQGQGGQGGQGGTAGTQMSGFLQPGGGGGGGGGAFARAGGMPMRQQAPPSAPAGQNYPAQATTQSQQAGWTPQ